MSTSYKAASNYSLNQSANGFEIFADKNLLMTPAGKTFSLPTLALAEAIRDEWQNQNQKIVFKSMHLTQLAAAAIDMSETEQAYAINHLLAYLGSELLCHRAESPEALRIQQNLIWQPLLDWCGEKFDAPLNVGSGIMPIPQNPKSIENFRKKLEAYTSFQRVGLVHATDICGSLVLGLLLTEGHLAADTVFEASELDTSFQILTWQEDEETAKRRLKIRNDLYICEKWFQLIVPKS